MSSICQVCFIGRLTFDPEQKIPASGEAYTRLRLAWSQKKDVPGYIDATLFGRTGEVAFQYLKKGAHISLMGSSLEWRQWDDKDTGVKRTAYSLVGGRLVMLGKKDDNAAPVASTGADIPFGTESDDQVPF